MTSAGRDVFVTWGAGQSHTALDLAHSSDGGMNFASPRRILAESPVASLVSAGPQIATGSSGLVCVVCDWTSQQGSSGDMVGRVVALCSNDAGRSFSAPVRLGHESADIALSGGVRPTSGPTVAVSPGGDVIYVAFPTHKPESRHSDIVVTASHDRGRTWSKAVAATPQDTVIYFQTNLVVDEAGRVAISAFVLANGRVDEVLLVSRTRDLRFDSPLRVSTSSFNPLDSTTPARGKYGSWWIGDWQGIASSGEDIYLV